MSWRQRKPKYNAKCAAKVARWPGRCGGAVLPRLVLRYAFGQAYRTSIQLCEVHTRIERLTEGTPT